MGSGALAVSLIGQQLFHYGLERRKVIRRNIPEGIGVHPVVGMPQQIAQIGNSAPWELSILTNTSWKGSGAFTNNFKQPLYAEEAQPILGKAVFIYALQYVLNFFDRAKNVEEAIGQAWRQFRIPRSDHRQCV